MQKPILLIFIFLIIFHWQTSWTMQPADSIPSTWEKHLDEVEITEKKTARTLSAFKTLNVDAKPYFQNLTTASALQQIPSFNIDIEGNTRLRGSSRISLLYEGIPITLFEENRGDMLIQMPVSLFSSILTYNMLPISMTNEGEAGAVNFIFSPEFSDKGINKVNIGTGTNQRYNASLLTGARTQKFRWQLGYDYRQEYRYRTYRKTTIDQTGITNMNNNAGAWPRTHLALFSVQYLLNPSDIIGFNGLFSKMSYDRLGNINNTKTNPSGIMVANVLRQRNNTEKQLAHSGGLDWKHIWKAQQAVFEMTVNDDNFNYDQGNNFANKKPGSDVVLSQDRLFIEQNKHQWFASARFSKQFTKNFTGQIGYMAQWHKDNFTASDDDLVNSFWVHNVSKSTNYLLGRNLKTGFAEMTYTTRKAQCRIGTQTLFDNRNGGDTDHTNNTVSNHFYLLPHINIIYYNSPFSSWTFNYQERINRPLLSDLNPFIDSSDATYIHQGNPSLSNEKVRLAEVSNTCRLQMLTLNTVLFYRYRSNQIVDVATQVNSSTVWTKENAKHSQDTGLELNLKWNPATFVTAEASATAYHYEIDGTRQGYGIKGKYACDAKGSISSQLPLGFRWDVYGYYTDRQLTVQGTIAALGCVGSALSWSGFSGHLNVSLSIDNIFDSIGEKTTLNTPTSLQTIYRNRDARTGWLSISYRL